MRQDPEISELKRQIGRLAEGAARRIPERLGWRIGQAARVRIEAGRTKTSVADELGISLATLNRALKVPTPSPGACGADERGFVRVVPVMDDEGLRIRLAGGEVIEGLSLQDVIAFARGMR